MENDYKQNFVEITQLIRWMPPISIYPSIPIKVFDYIFNYWYWLWKYFDCYMSPDKQNPVSHNENLSEEFKNSIRVGFSKYQALLNLIYVTESLIRKEAEARGESLATFNRLDFIERIMLEECYFQISLLREELSYWEGHNERNNEEIKRELYKIFNGKEKNQDEIEINKYKLQSLENRYNKIDKKLIQNIDISEIMPFTIFCCQIFREQDHLPEVQAWLKASNEGIQFFKIIAAYGDIKQFPGRGKNK